MEYSSYFFHAPYVTESLDGTAKRAMILDHRQFQERVSNPPAHRSTCTGDTAAPPVPAPRAVFLRDTPSRAVPAIPAPAKGNQKEQNITSIYKKVLLDERQG